MGYLEMKDYTKIKSILELFLDNPMRIDNIFKSLVLFLETKNTIPIKMETNDFKPTDKISHIKVDKEIRAANTALDKFSNKLLKESAKQRKHSSAIK